MLENLTSAYAIFYKWHMAQGFNYHLTMYLCVYFPLAWVPSQFLAKEIFNFIHKNFLKHFEEE